MIKIIKYNYDYLHEYRRIFTNKKVRRYIQNKISTDFYKWNYFIKRCSTVDNYINLSLSSKYMKVVQLGIKYGAANYNMCLLSKNIDVITYGISRGATNYNLLLRSSNMEIVKMGIKLGASDFSECLYSSNFEVVKLGLSVGICENIIYSSNLEAVQLGINTYNPDPHELFSSSNLDIVKMGKKLGAHDYNVCLTSSSKKVVLYGLSKGADNLELLYQSKKIDMILMAYNLN